MRAQGVAAIVLLLVLGYVMWGRFVESVIFQPSPGVDLTPAQLGIAGEEVTLVTEDPVLGPPGAGRRASRAPARVRGNR